MYVADENSLEEKLSSAPTQPTEEPTSVSVSTMEEPRLSNLTPPTKQPPTPVKEIDVIDIPIEVRLPTGSSITVTALNTDNIHNFKSKIEAVEPSYPSSHQRLVKPGRCDDILDEDELHQHIKYFCRDRFVLRGK